MEPLRRRDAEKIPLGVSASLRLHSTGKRPLRSFGDLPIIAPHVKNPRVSFVSLGCAKNLVDSEVLLGHLAKGGFDLCADSKQSDVVVVNTCGFLASSEKES